MDTNNFILNDIFKKIAKAYQAKSVRATKYQPGIENGWKVVDDTYVKVEV